MKIIPKTPADNEVYKKYYWPLLVREGFHPDIVFNELAIYIEVKYEGWTGGINSDREHFNPNKYKNQYRSYVKMITFEEWIAAGNDPRLYERVAKHRPSSLIHEIHHYIHTTKYGRDGSSTWLKLLDLIGEKPDFAPQNSGDYWWKTSYEVTSNYFESCLELRKKDNKFLQFVRDVCNIKLLRFKSNTTEYFANGVYKHSDEPTENKNGRIKVPLRTLAEELEGVTVRKIEWLPDFEEAIFIGGDF
jgi:hypothetical protein